MARRKAAARSRSMARPRRRTPARTTSARPARRRKAVKKTAKRRPRAVARKTARPRRRTVAKVAKKAARPTGRPVTKVVKKAARAAAPKRRATVVRAARPIPKSPARGPATPLPAITSAPPPPTRSKRAKAPAIDRQRRLLDEPALGAPSSLNLDSHASAARTGRAELLERLDQHTESSPDLTAGDVDANWEEAYSSGEEAPGGDNPTPDQDVVEEIGRALGVEYADNEELKSADKIASRDRHRWEFDPASAEDYRDRTKN